MMNVCDEEVFFHTVAVKALQLVAEQDGQVTQTKNKEVIGDITTAVDLSVEKVIIEEINRHFQGDAIMAEESYSGVALSSGRTWIVDPICGTTNLSRGIKWFCTNIALAEGGQVIASCVIDHSQGAYYWSTGKSEVHIGHRLLPRADLSDRKSIFIDADFGAFYRLSDEQKRKHCNAIYELSLKPGYRIISPSSSLGFAYTAVGRIDGFINAINYPWDIAAGAFLVQQAGGVVTDLDGQPWKITSIGAIGAADATVHRVLVDGYALAV